MFKTPDMEKKSFCVLKHEERLSEQEVVAKMLDVNTNSKRNLKRLPAAEVILQDQKRLKMECRDKHVKDKFVITKEDALAGKENFTP
jgi:hypothetical protein